MRIELLTPHEHAGSVHPAGAVLDLPDDAARWCVAAGVARRAKSPSQKATPQPTATPTTETASWPSK